jgi:hypothetical protein
MFEAQTLKLVEGEVMYLTGATLNAMAAVEGCHELLDAKGLFVEDEKFYKLTAEGIEQVE